MSLLCSYPLLADGLRHTEGKSVLAVAKSNETMRKFLHVWDEASGQTMFEAAHARLLFRAPFSAILSSSSCTNTHHMSLLSRFIPCFVYMDGGAAEGRS